MPSASACALRSLESDGATGPVTVSTLTALGVLLTGISLLAYLPQLSNLKGIVAGWIQPKQAPSITFRAHYELAPYPRPDGVVIGGIPWQKEYTDVRLDVVNGLAELQNLDVQIDLNASIVATGQISQFPGVTAFSAIEGFDSVQVQIKDENGRRFSVPVVPNTATPGLKTSFVSSLYRLRCERLFTNSTVNLVVALYAPMCPVLTDNNWGSGFRGRCTFKGLIIFLA